MSEASFVMAVVLLVLASLLVIYTVAGAILVHRGNMSDTTKKFFSGYIKMASFLSFLPQYTEPVIDIPPTPSTVLSDDIVAPSTPQNSIPIISPPLGVKARASAKTAKCITKMSVYKSNARFLDNLDYPSISSNENAVSNLCYSGRDLITTGCSNSFFDPIKDPGFVSVCCNGIGEHKYCTPQATQCSINKSKLYNKAYLLSNFNDSVLVNPDNKNALINFCELGRDIIDNGCTDDEYHPMKNKEFKKYCCNGSDDPTKCSPQSLQCSLDSSSFINSDYSTQTMQLSSIDSNRDIIRDYCNIGINLISNDCILTDPMRSQHFKDTCCNGSEDSKDCNESSMECIINSSIYNNSEYDLRDMKLESVNSNREIISDFCEVGDNVAKSQCKSIDPTKNKMFTDFCCDGSNNPADCDERALQCTFDLSDFTNTQNDIDDLQLSSWTKNKASIVNFCNIGKNIEDNECKTQRPINSNIFRNMCCNNSVNTSECNDQSMNCVFGSSDFNNKDYTMQNMAISSTNTNKDSITDYCTMGIDLENNGCTQLRPVNSEKFRQFCCNNSTHPEDCNLQSLECLFSSGDFERKNYSLSNTDISAVNANKDNIISYCKLGEKINSDGCKQTIPVTSSKFREFCCNDSVDSQDCNDKSLNCTFDSADFSEIDSKVKGVEIYSANANKGIITDYCTLGEKLITDGCKQILPVNSENFRQFCCNNSTHPEDCNLQSLQCTFNGSEFMKTDEGMQNMDLSAVNSNTDRIIGYCDLGGSIINSGCTQIRPTNSEKFRTMCCNNSTNPENCNDNSLNCLFDSGRFEKLTNDLGNITLSSVNSNKDKIDEFCNLGISIQENGCNQTIPINSDMFRKFCCNGSLDPTKCTPNSFQCTLDSGNFVNEDYDNKNITLESIVYPQTRQIVTDYCNIGDSILSRECTQTNPINSDQFRKLCCNTETDKTKCNPDSLKCTLDTSDFLNTDYKIGDVDISDVGNNIDMVTNYCNLGNGLIDRGCKLTYPTNSEKFRQFCCNNTTDPYKCNKTSLDCTIKSNEFVKTDYDMTTIKLLSNTGYVSDYCNLGLDIIDKGCNVIQPLTSNFIKFCCNGVADKGKCSMSSLQCLINANKIYGKVDAFTLLNYPTNVSGINSSNGEQLSEASSSIKEYCDLLSETKDIDGCDYNTEGVNRSAYANKYNNLCPVVDCIPDLVSYQNAVDSLSKNTTDNKILSAFNVCALGDKIISSCPSLSDTVKNYGGFYSSFCPQKQGCGDYIGTYYSFAKTSYKNSPNNGTLKTLCDTGNNSIMLCGDGTMNSNNWYSNYISTDPSYSTNCKPVDCTVSDWSQYTPCDCDGNSTGKYTRTRNVITPPQNYGAKSCPPLSETLECTDCAPLDCLVSEWGPWSACSAIGCTDGTMTRSRTVTRQNYNGGASCPPLTEQKTCTGPCDCVVSDWNEWSLCPVDNCYNDPPVSTRTRTVIRPPSGGGENCPALSDSHNCQSSCKYRIYPNFTLNKSPTQQYKWFARAANDVECANRCVNQPGCKSASLNGYYYGQWRCEMYDFRNSHYWYPYGYNMVYPYTPELPKNTSGLPNSVDNLIGLWADTSNNKYNISVDNTNVSNVSNNTTVKAVNINDQSSLTLSVDIPNKAVYWVGTGVVANMPDNLTLIFSNGSKWSKQ